MTEHDNGEYLGDIARPSTGPGESAGTTDSSAGMAILATELGETRAHLAELRDQLGDVLQEVAKLDQRSADIPILANKIHTLTDLVDELLKSDDGAASRPQDLAHIPPEERAEVLGDLAAWVRDVVFTGWPWTAVSLRPCWLQHPDLINAMLWLRAAYAAAYDMPKARPHAAADWHRWLDDVMATAERRTAGCPALGSGTPHAVPLPARDDTPQLDVIARREALAELHSLADYVREGAPYPVEDVDAARGRWETIVATSGVTETDYQDYVTALRHTQQQAQGTRQPPN